MTTGLTFGGGITIGGGITLETTAGGGGGGGGGPAADITGSAQILLGGGGSYGAANGGIGGYGALTSTPTTVQFFQWNVSFGATLIMLIEGTSGGVTVSGTDVNGHTAISVTCNGVTATSEGAPVDMGGAYLRFQFTGDPFGIVAAQGATLPYSITFA